MDKRFKHNKYSASFLKNGYEAMAKINLSFAESGFAADAIELLSYETNLGNDEHRPNNYFNMGRDNFDD